MLTDPIESPLASQEGDKQIKSPHFYHSLFAILSPVRAFHRLPHLQIIDLNLICSFLPLFSLFFFCTFVTIVTCMASCNGMSKSCKRRIIQWNKCDLKVQG